MPRVIHANARAFDDGKCFREFRFGDEKIVAQQIVPVPAAVNFHRTAQQSWPVRSVRNISHRLQRAQQNRRAIAGALCHDIHAMMHAVNQIHIRKTRRAEHDLGSFGDTFRGMRRQIMRAEIRFDLDDFSDALQAAVSMN